MNSTIKTMDVNCFLHSTQNISVNVKKGDFAVIEEGIVDLTISSDRDFFFSISPKGEIEGEYIRLKAELPYCGAVGLDIHYLQQKHSLYDYLLNKLCR